MTVDDFRRLALALPEATEAAHMAHPDFRVRNRIFATLWPKEGRGVVMLTPEQQKVLIELKPVVFSPVPGLGTTWIDQRQPGSRGRDEFNQLPAHGLAQQGPEAAGAP